MTRRLARKIARNPWRYTDDQCARAYRRLYRGDPDQGCNEPDATLAWYLRGPEAIRRSRASLRRERVAWAQWAGSHHRYCPAMWAPL